MKNKSQLDKKIESLEILLSKLKKQREEEKLNCLLEEKIEKILKTKIEDLNPNTKIAFTVQEAILKYSTSRSTIERAIKANKLPVSQKEVGCFRLIKKADLDNFFFNS